MQKETEEALLSSSHFNQCHCPANKNTYHTRTRGLNVPPKSEHQFSKGSCQGTLEVVPAGFPGPWPQTDFWKWEWSGYRDKHFSGPLLLWGLFPGTLSLGCWEESLLRIRGIFIKKWSFLETKDEPEWTLTSEYPNEIKAFNMKRPSSVFGTSNC